MALYNKLYIIGNGFDIYSGLDTRYTDFKEWLKSNYIFVYENMCSVYGLEGEIWSDLEEHLADVDVKEYIERFSNLKINGYSDTKYKRTIELYKEGDGLPHADMIGSKYAQRLRGLLVIFQCCFENWVKNSFLFRSYSNRIELDKRAFFFSFNYTDTLEEFYEIPENQILHIHGRASKNEKLVIGHGKSLILKAGSSIDVEGVLEELSFYEKNPYYYIFQHKDLKDYIKNINSIEVIGVSFCPVDEYYFNWIIDNTPNNCLWSISWHTENDKNRINDFIKRHPEIKNKCSIFSL